MKKDKHKTVVIFRIEKDRQILACFPYEIYSRYTNECYAHLGQHSALNWDYLRQTKPCKNPKQYKALKQELESIGYNLTIAQKRNYTRFLKANNEAMQLNNDIRK